MKFKLHIIFFLTCIFCGSSCHKPDATLKKVDNLMMSNPSEALATLTAENKYNSSDEVKLRTELCSASISLNKKDYPLAMKSAMHAYFIACQLKDNRGMAQACNLIGNILFITNNNLQAAQYVRNSIEYYKAIGDTASERYAIGNLARVYLNKGNNAEALFILDSLKNEIYKDKLRDYALISHIEAPRLVALANIKGMKELTADEMELISNDKSEFSLVKNILAMIWRTDANQSGRLNADSLLSKIKRETNADEERGWVMYAMYKQARRENNNDRALQLADSLHKLQNEVYSNLLEESVVGIQRDFIDGKLTAEKHSSHHKSWIIAIVIFVAAAIILMIIFIARLRARIRVKNMEIVLLELNELRTRAAEAATLQTKGSISDYAENSDGTDSIPDSPDPVLLEVIQHLFTSKWQTINALCDSYMASKTAEEGNSNVAFKQIEREIKKLRSQTTFDNLEKAVDTFKGNAMTRCREQLPELKDAEYNMLTLLMLGMSPRTISLFLNIELQNFYQRRTRLRNKIASNYDISNINDYLTLLK